MAIYFFNLRDGSLLLTASEGQEFESLADAKLGAEEGAREMLAELVKAGKEIDGQVIDILDSLGTTVGMVRLIDQLHLKPSAASQRRLNRHHAETDSTSQAVEELNGIIIKTEPLSSVMAKSHFSHF